MATWRWPKENILGYEENPCSLSSSEAKLSHDPLITLNPYNKEQTRQVNLIQSNLFNYGELESGNRYLVWDFSSTALKKRVLRRQHLSHSMFTSAEGLCDTLAVLCFSYWVGWVVESEIDAGTSVTVSIYLLCLLYHFLSFINKMFSTAEVISFPP